MVEERKSIKPAEKETIIQALRAGVVPRAGLHHIQVGRAEEIEQLTKDIDLIAAGGSSIRLVIGEYGAGKTFFLNLVRLIALKKKLLVVNADLAPHRRIHSTGGHARQLFAELARNMSTRTKVDGGALASVVERFVSQTVRESEEAGISPEKAIEKKLAPLEDLVSGYDFTKAVMVYFQGAVGDDDEAKSRALRWLRAEYPTKTEARDAIGVRSIIDDAGFYDYLKLYGDFAKIAGYDGLLIVLDELVNLYKVVNSQARNSNYEQILRILNDILQGNAQNIGFVMGGTPEFLMDTRRGLYSYEALQSRLAENTFASGDLKDLSGPIIRLQNLTPEELYVLLHNIRHVFAGGIEADYLLPDEALKAFMEHCSKRIGNAYFQTPRNSIKAFVDLLAILDQNPEAKWSDLVTRVEVEKETLSDDGETGEADGSDDDDLQTFKL